MKSLKQRPPLAICRWSGVLGRTCWKPANTADAELAPELEVETPTSSSLLSTHGSPRSLIILEAKTEARVSSRNGHWHRTSPPDALSQRGD